MLTTERIFSELSIECRVSFTTIATRKLSIVKNVFLKELNLSGRNIEGLC